MLTSIPNIVNRIPKKSPGITNNISHNIIKYCLTYCLGNAQNTQFSIYRLHGFTLAVQSYLIIF